MFDAISILVPMYNHSMYIKDLLDSIEKIENCVIEVIIIDDGSTDNSYQTVLEVKDNYNFEIRLYRHENIGVVKTLNKLIGLSKHEIICMVASDDILIPGDFEKRLNDFNVNKKLAVYYSNGLVYEDKKTKGFVHNASLESILLTNDATQVYNHIVSCVPGFFIQGMLIKKQILFEINYFDENLIADDWALNIKIFRFLMESRQEYCYSSTPVFLYRLHAINSHKNMLRQYSLIKQIVDNVIPKKNKIFYRKSYGYYFIKSLFNLNGTLVMKIIKDEKGMIFIDFLLWFISKLTKVMLKFFSR